MSNQNLDFQTKALVLRSQRQQVLAANIANGDTPGYVAKELNFSQALREASGSGAGRLNLVSSSDAKTPGHIGLEVGSSIVGGFLYEDASEVLRDGMAEDLIYQAIEEAKPKFYRLSRVFGGLSEAVDRECV